jgi:hypothetical protein
MLARMAPVATRPDHTSTGLTPMMLGRRHQGGPRTLINSLEPCSATLVCFLGNTEVSTPSTE